MRHMTRMMMCLVSLVSLMVAFPALTPGVYAQGTQATLVGRALLPVQTLADGPQSGQALGQAVINGVKLPFDSQPVGTVAAILPGAYPHNWVWLSSGVYDSRQHSGDYLLRLYKIELNLRQANSGNGTVALSDWPTLADPRKRITQAIKNASTSTRELTGADFEPVAFAQTVDGTYWIAEGYGPSILHVNGDGMLLDAPMALGTGLVVQGITLRIDGNLMVALRASGSADVSLRTFDVGKKALGGAVSVYRLQSASNAMSSFIAINDHQAIAVEQDNKQNQVAQFKQVFLVDFGSNPANKTPLVDLLNIADPQNISKAAQFNQPANAYGIGPVFKFPYRDVSAIYPIDAGTLMVVNNNHVPFGTGRRPDQADDTDIIAIQLAQPLGLDPSFRLAQ